MFTILPRGRVRAALTAVLVVAIPLGPAQGAAADSPTYETVVTAPRVSAQRPQQDDAASATSVAPSSRPQTVDSLPDLLAEVPGVVVTRLGGLGAFASASIRGSTAQEVRVYLDGVPLDVAAGGGVDLASLPIGDLERVEVYRGVTPLAFGEPGLAGVIALTSRAPGQSSPQLKLGGGSFGTLTLAGNAGVKQGPLRVYVGLDALHSTGDFPYVDDAGTTATTADDQVRRRTDNDVEQLAGVLRVSVDLPERRRMTFGALAVARRQGLAGPLRAPATDVRLATTRSILYARYTAPGALGASSRAELQAYFAQYDSALDDRRGEIYMVPQHTLDSSWTAGASALATKTPASWLRAQAMLEVRAERHLPRDELPAATVTAERAPGHRALVAGGVEATAYVSPVHLDVIPSLRGQLSRDGSDSASGAQGGGHALTSLRASLVQHTSPDWRFKLNLGRYHRLPSLTELYVNNGFMRGDPGLRPEHGSNADVGFELDGGSERWRIRGQGTVFGALVSDMISWRVVRPAGAQYLVPANAASARIAGVEATLGVDGPWAALHGQLTFTDAMVETAGISYPLPLRPRWQGYARPELRWRWSVLECKAYVDGVYTSARPAASYGFAWLPARLVLGAGVRATHEPSGLALAISAYDLGNAQGNDALGYPLPGRSFLATFTWTAHRPQRSQEIP